MRFSLLSFFSLVFALFVLAGANSNKCYDVKNRFLTLPEAGGTEAQIRAGFAEIKAVFGCWRQTKYTGFIYDNEQVTFVVKFKNNLPNSFSDEQKALFVLEHEQQDDGSVVPIYVYYTGILPLWYTQTSGGSKQHHEKLRMFENNDPQLISIEACSSLIKDKKIVFLTGAGISVAANIHSLSGLWNDLGVEPGVLVDRFVNDVLCRPEKLKNKVLEFYWSARDAQPTVAHLAIAKMAHYKSCQVLTGNFDRLHERSGIAPYRVFYRNLGEFTSEEWQEIDAFITVGSSFDFREVLTHYKQERPDGIIIAFNLEKPNYLGDEDYLVQGDVQKTVPELAQLMGRPNIL